ncbi:F-box protein SNE [Hibiscus syriacus]|uniref:F-box protein SNE n=1 Tax=Hibiscus syriacus TaxID=106335 RepID=A0A6A3CTF0_HIBSY|nr:F-box protein SNE-like [Hibiscus syriacus]KAE8730528.1 F-box protein SNE [Hibiscus syriacus]
MAQNHHRGCHRRNHQETVGETEEKRSKFFINDHADILIEILKRLDGRSLCVAASVCRLWCAIARNNSLWENLCFRNVSPPTSSVRSVVLALGGYKRLYVGCVRPVRSLLGRVRRASMARDEVQLSLSLFCVDYYERLGGRNSNGRLVGESSPSSLMFLCKPVNV